MRPYYPDRYYGKRHGIFSRHCVKRRLGFVAAAIPNGSGRRLLDIGCGDGSFLLAAREVGWDVLGTEFNPGPARDNGLDVRESIDQFPPPASFDCITMWHTLEHMLDILSMLLNIGRLLKPGGKLVLAVPDFGGFQARIFGPKWLHADVPRHQYHFDAKALLHCLGAAGFSVQQKWHQEFEYDLLGWSQSTLNHIMHSSNVYFDCLTGKEKRYGKLIAVYGYVIGSFLTLLSLPAVALGTLCGQGGTLVVVACLKQK
jgi:SAM-dependent methyltransferase